MDQFLETMKQNFELDQPVLYTTGVFVQPMKHTKEDGSEIWLWVVTEFDGDTFHNSDVHNPKEYGDTKEELLIAESEVDDR